MQPRRICQEKKRNWRAFEPLEQHFGSLAAEIMYSPEMRFRVTILLCGLFVGPLLRAQTPPAQLTEDYSGMYSFLKDGEFVQITIEDKGKVSGFISRFGDTESDRGLFMNQFFKSG